MTKSIAPLVLNLGCGFKKMVGCVNVDAFQNCQPDVLHDLNKLPYPWADNSVDGIEAHHIIEHLDDWWAVFVECARILRPGGFLHIRVPHDSSSTALTYRDHFHIFSPHSFHGTVGATHGTSAWAETENDSVPLMLTEYYRVPFRRYEWMTRWCPWLLAFCADHLRNFIWEQRFHFKKVGKHEQSRKQHSP